MRLQAKMDELVTLEHITNRHKKCKVIWGKS